jgi:PiT family inorganic phosphate transporter
MKNGFWEKPVNQWDLLIPLLFLVSAQDTLTGVFGAPSIVATMIASNAMAPHRAILLSTCAQLIGPCVFGVAVATSIGSEVIDPRAITPAIIFAALGATVAWMLAAWFWRIPCSSTHALVGGLVGAGFAGLGASAIHESGLLKIVLGLTLTAPLGILVGFGIARLCRALTRRRHADRHFNRGQFVVALFLGLAVGSNNAQNAMGVTVLGLMATGFLPRFEVPLWVIVGSGVCLALGNLVGGMRLMRSVGTQFFEVRPLHGFSAEMSSTLIIIASSLVGGDVSTTHVTSMSIVGAGAAESVRAVQWRFVRRVLLTWVLTIPATALLAGSICLLLTRVGIH